jgi:hypothetical protein
MAAMAYGYEQRGKMSGKITITNTNGIGVESFLLCMLILFSITTIGLI